MFSSLEMEKGERAAIRQRVNNVEEKLGIDRRNGNRSDVRCRSKIRELDALTAQCKRSSELLEHGRLELQARITLFVKEEQSRRRRVEVAR